jgi:hypothetical protein
MRHLVTILLLAVTAAAQQKPISEAQSFTRPSPKVGAPAPGLHLEIANPAVRVFRIDLPARGTVAIGREVRDYMLVAVSGGSAEIAGFANNYQVDLKSGEVEIFKGGWPHQLRNKSDQPSTWIVLELSRPLQPERASCGLAGPGCSQFKFGKTDQGEYNESVLFETPSARVLRAELAAASTLPTHEDRRDHVVVPLSTCTLALNGDSSVRKSGEPTWIHGGFPELRNAGSQAASFVILEIK